MIFLADWVMRDFARQSKACVAAYLARSLKAKRCADQNDHDGFIAEMRSRTEAFHNLVAASSLAAEAGIDVFADPVVKAELSEALSFSQLLTDYAGTLLRETDSQIVNLRNSRDKISRYRSGQQVDQNFSGSV
jgi:hypothetical protein